MSALLQEGGSSSLEPPRPTRDCVQASADLEKHGYCYLADALSPAQLEQARDRLDAQAAAERAAGIAQIESNAANQRVWFLVNKGAIFRELVLHPVVSALIGELLGAKFILSSFSANIAGKGGKPMILHQDQAFMPTWTEDPMVANALFMLDDFFDANGGTRIVPGSHRVPTALGWKGAPPGTETIAASAPAGTAMIFDGRLWHGTGANQTDTPRRGLLSYFTRPFVRQQENFALGCDRAMLARQSEEYLARLGFRIDEGYGLASKGGRDMEGTIVLLQNAPVGELP